MSTFLELQKKLKAASYRRVVLRYMIDLMESEFISTMADAPAKRVLLTDEKIPVPSEAFTEVVDKLYAEVDELNGKIDDILNSNLDSKGE